MLDALECCGKDDEYLIDKNPNGHFSCYADTSQHITLCLRRKIEQPSSGFEFQNQNSKIQFNTELFNFLAWEICDNADGIQVRVPTAFVTIMARGDDVEELIDTLSFELQDVVRALSRAHIVESDEKLHHVNSAITLCLRVNNLYDIPVETLMEINNIINTHQDFIYGYDSTFWINTLEPKLIKVMNEVLEVSYYQLSVVPSKVIKMK